MNFDCLVMNADATRKETLEDAGADRADAIIATTDKGCDEHHGLSAGTGVEYP